MLRKLAILGLAAYAGKKLIDQAFDGPSRRTSSFPAIGHAPTDMGGASRPDGSQRADDHFRPDPHASVPPQDREGLRPVTVEPARQPLGV